MAGIGTRAARELLEESLGEGFEKLLREAGEEGVQELAERMGRELTEDGVREILARMLSRGARENLSELTAEGFERTMKELALDVTQEVVGTTTRRTATETTTEVLTETAENTTRRTTAQTLNGISDTIDAGVRFGGKAIGLTVKGTALALVAIPAAGIIYNHGHHAVDAFNAIKNWAWNKEGEAPLTETQRDHQTALFMADTALAGLKFKETVDGEHFYTYTSKETGEVSTYVQNQESPTKWTQVMEDGTRKDVTPEEFVAMRDRFRTEDPAAYDAAVAHKNAVLAAIEESQTRARGFIGNMLADWGMDNPILMKLADVMDHGGLGMAAGLAIAGLVGPSAISLILPNAGPLAGIIGGLGTPLLLGAAAITAVMSFVNPEPEVVSPLDRLQSPLGLGPNGREREVPAQEQTVETGSPELPSQPTRPRSRDNSDLEPTQKKAAELEDITGVRWQVTTNRDGKEFLVTVDPVDPTTGRDASAYLASRLDVMAGLTPEDGNNSFTTDSASGRMYVPVEALTQVNMQNLRDKTTQVREAVAETEMGQQALDNLELMLSTETARNRAFGLGQIITTTLEVETRSSLDVDGKAVTVLPDAVGTQAQAEEIARNLNSIMFGDGNTANGFEVRQLKGIDGTDPDRFYVVVGSENLESVKERMMLIGTDENGLERIRTRVEEALGFDDDYKAASAYMPLITSATHLETSVDLSGQSGVPLVVLSKMGGTREEAEQMAEELNSAIFQAGPVRGGFGVSNVRGTNPRLDGDPDTYYVVTTPERISQMRDQLQSLNDEDRRNIRAILEKNGLAALLPDMNTGIALADERISGPTPISVIQNSTEIS